MAPWERYQQQAAPAATGGAQPWLKYKQPEAPQPEQQIPQSLGRTALDQVEQGATFGFADEIMNPLGAVVATAMKDPKALLTGKVDDLGLADALVDVKKDSKQRLSDQFEQHPVLSVGSQIGGALATGGFGASTKAGGAVANSLRGGNLAARMAKGAAAGAVSGGLYGAGGADDGERLEGAGQGAFYGGVTGGTIPAVGAAVGGVKNAILPKVADQEVKALAQKALDEGIPLRRSQIGDSRVAKTIASVTKDVPFSGAKGFADKQQAAFNKAVLSKADIAAEKATPDVLQAAGNTFNKKFADAISRTTIEVDDDLLDAFGNIEQEAAKRLGPDGQKLARSYVDDILASGGKIDGKTYQNARSNLGQMAKSKMGSDPFIGGLLKDMQSALDESAFKSLPPQGQQQWQNIRKQYGAYKTIQKAMNSTSADAAVGDISPGALANAAKTGNANYSKGAGELNDLARIGGRFVRDGVPNSGTAQRLGVGGAFMGAAPFAPLPVAKAIAASKGFNALDTSQRLVRGALKDSKAVTPLLSAPAGGAAGAISSEMGVAPLPKPAVRKTIQPQVKPAPEATTIQGVIDQDSIEGGIAEAEGVRDKAYKDTVGKTTVGIGFNMDDSSAKGVWKKAGIKADFDKVYSGKQKLTKDEIHKLANVSYGNAVKDAKAIFPKFDDLSDNRQKALVQMSYQLGGNKLSKFQETLKHLEKGNYKAAAKQIMNSKLAKQTPNRAKTIAKMIAYDMAYNDAK